MESQKKINKKSLESSILCDSNEFERLYAEKSSDKPVKTFVPCQAMSLSELVRRFENGQRLNVHSNFKPMSNFTQDCIVEESFDDAPPIGVYDVVDVEAFYREHQQRVKDYQRKKNHKQEQTPQAPQAPTPQAPQDVPSTPPPGS